MSEFSERIRDVAEEVGGLQRLAELIDVPRRTLGSWLEGRKPKPEAIQKIATAGGVNLEWLISGVGEKFTREKQQRIEEEMRQNREFQDGLDRTMRMIDQQKRQADPSYEMEIRALRQTLDVALLEKIARLVEDAHKEAGIKLGPTKISAVAGELYNELMARLFNPADPEEIEATLPQLRHFLKKRLEQAAAEPGTGKRSA